MVQQIPLYRIMVVVDRVEHTFQHKILPMHGHWRKALKGAVFQTTKEYRVDKGWCGMSMLQHVSAISKLLVVAMASVRNETPLKQ